jgi:Domain of unknown function (DUF4965)/Domain of unknown function (DUF5127)/Domain of unknown function (DUF1793)/Domain of unknown function (DUF4964)
MSRYEPSRRDLFRYSGLAAMAITAGPAMPRTARAVAGSLRPPATPLAVRSPYLSTWQQGDDLAGTWASFWNGRTTAFCGIARIDGTAYLFAGDPGSPALTAMRQESLRVTATRSIYTFTGGGVSLTVTFFSPVDLENLRRQCVPMSYVTMRAASADGASHAVDLHLDISGEWAHGDSNALIGWSQERTAKTVALTCTPSSPGVLQEDGDQASWGTVVLASPSATGLSWQIGQDIVVRGASAGQGVLGDVSDPGQPRAIDDDWPVLGLNRNLGTVTSTRPSALFQVVVGHVRRPAVSYLGTDLEPWWTTYWGSWQHMLDWFVDDCSGALSSAIALDRRIRRDATTAVGGGTGEHYAELCALALRQAVGGTELVDRDGAPWAFLKEISSDGNVSTVDVVYPGFPAYLYLSPAYLRYLLEPLLEYAEHGGWPGTFAEHDLGSHYPNASGHNDGVEEDMPIEESANMLIMTAALVRRMPAAEATAFARAHYSILHKWTEYLVGITLDPPLQNQTDDFSGPIAHSANLALKGIVGIGAMGLLAKAAGKVSDAAHYRSVSVDYIGQWATLADDPAGTHLKLAYDQPGTWSLKYNGFADRLLGLNLIPAGVKAREAAWYQANAGAYGVILDPRHDYTKADWELWTAAWLADVAPIRNTLIEGVYGFVDATPQRVPFSDWYVVPTAAQQGFQARPVVGGVFGLLLRTR